MNPELKNNMSEAQSPVPQVDQEFVQAIELQIPSSVLYRQIINRQDEPKQDVPGRMTLSPEIGR